MQEEKNIIDAIESNTPALSDKNRASMWRALESHIPTPPPQMIPSPFLFSHFFTNTMTPLIVILALVLGGGGTALASDAAKPGDFLFPLDRTLEDIHLRLALSEESKSQLTKQITEERLQELREIIDEELVVTPSNIMDDTSVTTATSSATSTLQIEANVFTDVTVIKMELGSQKFYFEAGAVTREGVIAEIQTRFPILTIEQIEAQLDFEVKDRASRPKDKGVVSLKDSGEVRINIAVEEILGFLDKNGLDDSNRDNLLLTLSSEIEGVAKVRHDDDRLKIRTEDNRYEIRVDDNGDSRIDIRDGESRIRVEEKDGEIKVKTTRNEETTVGTTSTTTLGAINDTFSFDVEANVFTDVTIVTIEFAHDTVTFETDIDTRAGIISEIQTRFPALTIAQIQAQLDFEIEDRAYRAVDVNTQSYDDDTDDDGEDYEDDGRSESDEEDDDREGEREREGDDD